MKSSEEPVVCFACYDYWHSNPGSPFHIMQAIRRRGHPVLWVNSIGMNLPRVRRRAFLKRALLRLRSWSRWLKKAAPDFYVLAPIALPVSGHRRLQQWSDRWLLLQLRLAYRLLGIQQPLVFACMPAFAGVVAALPRSGLIYYYTDKYDAYRDITAKSAIQTRDEQLMQSADAVFCASHLIYEAIAEERDNVHYLPHAVDYRHFNAAVVEPVPAPADLADIPHPRIGYFGSLTDSNDQELIHHAASTDPRLQFVLIGRVLSDYSQLEQLPNVHLLGFKSYESLPTYGSHFDVGFMGWKMTEWILHSSPVKLKEYLSLGLPVVATPIEELRTQYADLVYLASTPPEFLAAIQRALTEDAPEQRQRRQAAVARESWDERAAAMLKLYHEARHAS